VHAEIEIAETLRDASAADLKTSDEKGRAVAGSHSDSPQGLSPRATFAGREGPPWGSFFWLSPQPPFAVARGTGTPHSVSA
jgi:hypothetical protein